MFSVLFALVMVPSMVNAQPAKTAKLEIHDEQQLFPVIVTIDEGTLMTKEITFFGGKQPLIFDLPIGRHTVETRHYRVGFPQLARYELWRKVGDLQKRIWESEYTVDPRKVDLKDGDRLLVQVLRPLESYNCKFFGVKALALEKPKPGSLRIGDQDLARLEELLATREIPMAILMTRPYWFQDVDRPWKGREKYPNALFFLADEKEWGAEKVFHDLATAVVAGIHTKSGTLGDYRGSCHWTCLVGLTPDGKIPAALLRMKKEDLQMVLEKEFLVAYGKLLAEKTYRPWQPGDVAELKKEGFLPKEIKEGRLHMPIAQGLELAKGELAKWEKKKKK